MCDTWPCSCLQVHEYVRPKVEAAVDAARRVVDSREMASMPRQARLLSSESPYCLASDRINAVRRCPQAACLDFQVVDSWFYMKKQTQPVNTDQPPAHERHISCIRHTQAQRALQLQQQVQAKGTCSCWHVCRHRQCEL